MSNVGGDTHRQPRVVDPANVDSRIFVDLAQCGPQRVDDFHRFAPSLATGHTRQDHQRFRVAADACGEVVQLEEVGKDLGVLFAFFEFGDEVELAGHKALHASPQVQERVSEVPALSGLFHCQIQGALLDDID